ncbi:hypothetical protein GIB67_034469 [Kingdonia uniflora]|uniref:Uncharacterized protein n=1 Tax=Kingdonia uniflora TaxID=39325 RepID=A0A7J7PB03_9MAGN|nr:hypothetical protein GIB67_034469 [Kingdonia uniflora]
MFLLSPLFRAKSIFSLLSRLILLSFTDLLKQKLTLHLLSLSPIFFIKLISLSLLH